ncbi:MAG: hypothetical protein ACI4UY_02810 [Kiritimatiellia bacterium]
MWLWRDFPFRKYFGSGHDVGIDLVARTHEVISKPRYAGAGRSLDGVRAEGLCHLS